MGLPDEAVERSYDARGERIEALEGALKPFAAFAADPVTVQGFDGETVIMSFNGIKLTNGDFRRAVAALAQSPSAPQGEGEASINERPYTRDIQRVDPGRYYPDRFEDQNMETEREEGEQEPCDLCDSAGRCTFACETPPQGDRVVFADSNGDPAVHRVCEVIKGDCLHCPVSETIGHHENVTRGCYLQARECVNTVETGNPWRKTANVKAPWIVLAPLPAEVAALVEEARAMVRSLYYDEQGDPQPEPYEAGLLRRLAAALEHSARRVGEPSVEP